MEWRKDVVRPKLSKKQREANLERQRSMLRAGFHQIIEKPEPASAKPSEPCS